MNATDEIVRIILEHYPETQAVYLFGTYGTPYERVDSDVDIGVLLSHAAAKHAAAEHYAATLAGDAWWALERLLHRDVDLINLRRAPTVLQKEVIMAERRVFCADERAADEFELLVLSLYQKLNQERAEIVADGGPGGRFYDV